MATDNKGFGMKYLAKEWRGIFGKGDRNQGDQDLGWRGAEVALVREREMVSGYG